MPGRVGSLNPVLRIQQSLLRHLVVRMTLLQSPFRRYFLPFHLPALFVRYRQLSLQF